MSNSKQASVTRRDFVKTATAASLAATFAGRFGVFAAGSDVIKVGVIGCGGRGTGAALDCLKADPGVEIVALGDLVPDRVASSLARLTKEFPGRVNVPPERQFTGFDNYQQVCALPEVNLIVTAAPPGFRPRHLEAAIKAGKHVFMEKPVAVDPVGIRSIIATSDLAKQKNLAIVAGTQRRHQRLYNEMMQRIHDGQIGEIVAAQCYWNQGDLWVRERTPAMSEMEWQCRNWLYFTWLSGDHIVEQHVHNIDVINWAMGAMPRDVMGMGGRQVRVGPQYGNIYDHFAVEYEYPNGVRMTSMCRQTKGCADRVDERIVGTKGVAWGSGKITGERPWTFEEKETNPYVQEHIDLIASIRKGAPLNEGRQIAESTLCAVMGRMSAYTGRALSWDWAMNASKLDLSPARYEFGPNPVDAVAMPGFTQLV
ncbi:MAG TPA: Gfo/Idh/MocA family oxidoreductase [Vicinamibacterales bacterium]|nr:Gfo/Idh/MocA family oxidoreductase [Vicinamibacterales bacterium]